MILSPEAVKDAIDGGAVWNKNKLVISGVANWPKVNGSTWELSTSQGGACQMRKIIFDQVASAASSPDGTLIVPPSATWSGGVYMLTPVTGWAELRDPV